MYFVVFKKQSGRLQTAHADAAQFITMVVFQDTLSKISSVCGRESMYFYTNKCPPPTAFPRHSP
jgi:hypothetical protein